MVQTISLSLQASNPTRVIPRRQRPRCGEESDKGHWFHVPDMETYENCLLADPSSR